MSPKLFAEQLKAWILGHDDISPEIKAIVSDNIRQFELLFNKLFRAAMPAGMRIGGRPRDFDKRREIEKDLKHMSVADVAKKYEVTTSAVYKMSDRIKKDQAIRIDAARKDHEAGMSIEDIAVKYGVAKESVIKRLGLQ